MSKELAKAYEPREVEDRIYDFWLQGGYFHAEVDPEKKPYTIVIPPPNIRAIPPFGCRALTTPPSLRKRKSWRL